VDTTQKGGLLCGVIDNGIPRYSVNPPEAMAVLEKCTEKCSRPMMSGGSISDVIGVSFGCGKYSVGFGPAMSGYADTLPLAICKFAFLLFGGGK
jgi:hypothetical protein